MTSKSWYGAQFVDVFEVLAGAVRRGLVGSDVEVDVRRRPVPRPHQLPDVADVQLEAALPHHARADIAPLRDDRGLFDVEDHGSPGRGRVADQGGPVIDA